jgi:hypothetical protein
MRVSRIVLLAALAGCRPDTTRPSFLPLPEAASTEIRLSPQEATQRLAEGMAADSLPPSRIQVRDGYIETRWLDSATGQPTRRRPLGTGVVKIQAWSDPGRPGFAVLTVETLYRPLADPSLPGRELDRQVPRGHPVGKKVEKLLEGMVKRYGGPPQTDTLQRRPPAEEYEDTE